MKPSNTPVMIDIADVARELRVSHARVYQMVAAKQIPSIRVGRLIRIPAAAWERWLDEQNVAAREQMTKADPVISDVVGTR